MKLRLPRFRFAVPETNPIVVKELRQAVRSRFVTSALVIFLFVEVIVTGVVLVTSRVAGIQNVTAEWHAGKSMFSGLYAILCGSCMLFVPAYTGVRLGMERWDNNLDLLYVSTISPSAIIRGKLLAACVVALLLFCAAAPFMSFSMLLRGVDLISIFITLCMSFAVLVCAIQTAIFLACAPTSRIFKVLLGVASVAGLGVLMTAVIGIGGEMVDSGLASMIGSWDFWGPTLVFLGVVATLVGFVHVLSIAVISPVSSNRALPVRAFVTIAWLVWGGVAMYCSARFTEVSIMYSWLGISIVLFAMAMLTAVGETERLSARIKRTIPQRWPGRVFAYMFYNGPAGGLLWSLVCGVLSLAITAAYVGGVKGLVRGLSGSRDLSEVLAGFGAAFAYVTAYVMLGVLVWRIVFRKDRAPHMRAGISLILMSCGAVLPSITAFMLRKFSWETPGVWQLGNIFMTLDDEYRVLHCEVAVAAAAVFFVLNKSWFAKQWKAFKCEKSSACEDACIP